MTDDLFGSWLLHTRDLQINSFGTDPHSLDGEDREQFVLWNVYAAIDELSETMSEISWKPWATAKFFNREQYVGELVDVLHFVGNLLSAAGCTDEELNQRYTAKMQKNRDRQANGYTGTDKCPLCDRALDDVGISDVQLGDGRSICVLCGSRIKYERHQSID